MVGCVVQKVRSLVALLAAVFVAPVWAGGMSLHMFQSDKAFKQIEEPELKTLLTTYKEAWISGTQYPDAGYSPGFIGQPSHIWGEASHWAPFIMEYAALVKEQCQGRYTTDPDCGKLTAHLLGAAAHGMQDQVFDALFVPKVNEVDHKGQETTDTGLDMVLLVEHNRKAFVPKHWYTPVEQLEEVYRRMGFTQEQANADQIRFTSKLSAAGNVGERIAAPLLYWHYKAMMPWASRNYMRYPGGVEFGGKVTANLWRYLWRLLNDQPQPPMPAVTVLPAPGATNVAIDKRNTDMQISITFDRYIVPYTANRDSVQVVDESGHFVRGRIGLFANSNQITAEANMIYFRPDEPLLPDTTYTVHLSGAILDDQGRPFFGLEGYAWQFHTEPAHRYVQLQTQGFCLGLRHYEPGASALVTELHDCRITRHQHWYFDDAGRVHNRERPDLCLQPKSANLYPGVIVTAASCESTADQLWRYDDTTGHLTLLQAPQLGMGTFLNAWRGLETSLLPVGTDPRRQWQVTPVGLDVSCPDGGVYRLCF